MDDVVSTARVCLKAFIAIFAVEYSYTISVPAKRKGNNSNICSPSPPPPLCGRGQPSSIGAIDAAVSRKKEKERTNRNRVFLPDSRFPSPAPIFLST